MKIGLPRIAARVLMWLLVVGWLPVVACGHTGEEPSVLAEIRERWPDAAVLLGDAARSPAQASGGRFAVRSVPAPLRRPRDGHGGAGKWTAITGSLSVELDPDGRSMVVVAGGRRIGVRRGGEAGAARIEDGVVALEGDSDGGAVFAARPHGVEELCLAQRRSEMPVYDFDLPAGWRLHRAPGFAGLVEVLDPRGVPALRLVSRMAWDGNGREIAVEAVVEGNRVRLAVPASAPVPLLIDPEWQDVGSPFEQRERATATLLPNGKVLFAGGQNKYQGAPLGTAELFDPFTNTFSVAGKGNTADSGMTQSRANHVAVQLRNGKVLLAGGANSGEEVTDTAELYDPVSDSFEPAGTMTAARARFTGTLLPSGKVLLVGGAQKHKSDCVALNADEVATAEVFDPEADLAAAFEAVGPMKTARADHAATLLPNGRVLISGGQKGSVFIDTLESFDPAKSAFSAAGQLTGGGRRAHVSILVPGGQVLFAGGEEVVGTDDVTAIDSAELYQPASMTSTPVANRMADKRAYAAASLLPDGTVLIAGGDGALPGDKCPALDTAEMFMAGQDPPAFADADPPAPTLHFEVHGPTMTVLPTGRVLMLGRTDYAQLFDFAERAQGPTGVLAGKRNAHAAALLPSGDVLLVGGDNGEGQKELATAEIYRTSTGTVEPTGSMKHARDGPTATPLTDGRILVAGGTLVFPTEGIKTAEAYAAGKFDDVGPMTTGRAFHTATLLPSGKVLVAGGLVTGDIATNTAEVFDPDKNEFTPTKSVMVQARLLQTATLLPTGQVLLAGGKQAWSDQSALTTAELYDPATDTFGPAAEMAVPRFWHMAVALPNGRVFLAGGTTGKTEIYDPTGAGAFAFGPNVKRRIGGTATLLPNGKVILIGGSQGEGDSPTDLMEVFDPVATPISLGTTSPVAAKMQQFSWAHTATLLPTGDVLVAGGLQSGYSVLNEAVDRWELVTESPASLVSARPALKDAPASAQIGKPVVLKGANLTGISEATGSTASSSSAFPVALWMPVDGAPSLGVLAPWSSTQATWTPVGVGAPGYGQLFAVTNGVRSVGHPMALSAAILGASCEHGVACASGFCADGVCCSEACDESPCRACSKKTGSSADGTCADVAADQDPKEACEPLPGCEKVTGLCDGKGACQACPVVECVDDHTLLEGDQTRPCAPYRCSSELKNCLSTCTSKLDCVDGHSCAADGKCVPPILDESPKSGCALSPGPLRSDAVLVTLVALVALLATARGARRPTRSTRRKARVPCPHDVA